LAALPTVRRGATKKKMKSERERSRDSSGKKAGNETHVGAASMSEDWNGEELKAVVQSYVEMQHSERAGRLLVKKHYYKNLAERFGRIEKLYEYRMQNVS
jgi:hypothetical protein